MIDCNHYFKMRKNFGMGGGTEDDSAEECLPEAPEEFDDPLKLNIENGIR